MLINLVNKAAGAVNLALMKLRTLQLASLRPSVRLKVFVKSSGKLVFAPTTGKARGLSAGATGLRRRGNVMLKAECRCSACHCLFIYLRQQGHRP